MYLRLMGTMSHKVAYCISLFYLALWMWLLARSLAWDELRWGEEVKEFNDNGWNKISFEVSC